MRRPRTERVIPITILAAAVVLGVSELMATFRLTAVSGDVLGEEVASDRHGWAMLILAAFAIASVIVAMRTGQHAAAVATAGFGLAALAIFLIVDLPDVNSNGDVNDPALGLTAVEATPQLGFWLEAIAVVTLAISSIAYATFAPAQLRGSAGGEAAAGP